MFQYDTLTGLAFQQHIFNQFPNTHIFRFSDVIIKTVYRNGTLG